MQEFQIAVETHCYASLHGLQIKAAKGLICNAGVPPAFKKQQAGRLRYKCYRRRRYNLPELNDAFHNTVLFIQLFSRYCQYKCLRPYRAQYPSNQSPQLRASALMELALYVALKTAHKIPAPIPNATSIKPEGLSYGCDGRLHCTSHQKPRTHNVFICEICNLWFQSFLSRNSAQYYASMSRVIKAIISAKSTNSLMLIDSLVACASASSPDQTRRRLYRSG